MDKLDTNKGQWKPGQSGNPKGRKPQKRTLTEMLRLKGEAVIIVGGEPISAQEALAKAVWQFVTTGEVWLMGKKLEAQNVNEWASVVKWLYTHIEPARLQEAEGEPELVVQVVRVDKMEDLTQRREAAKAQSEDNPHPLTPSPLSMEGE
jgi:hypothetical protein